MAAFNISSLAPIWSICMEGELYGRHINKKLRVIIKGNHNKLHRREIFIAVCLILLTNFRTVTVTCPHKNNVISQLL